MLKLPVMKLDFQVAAGVAIGGVFVVLFWAVMMTVWSSMSR